MFRLSPGIVAILCLLLPVLTNLAEVSYHDLLGVSKKASQQEIRQAYKKLAIKLHPDKNPDKAVQERFLKITEAYETLKDPERRRQYETDINHKDLYQNGLYYDDPHVITITENHFDSYMVDGIHFINFYSPFCPPCQRLSEDWKKLAKVYKGIIKVGAVNCLFYNYFCRKMGINAYPTLRFYPNGKSDDFTHYKEQRSFNDLDKYVIRFLRERAKVDTISLLRGRDQPALYVIDKTKIFGRALTRLAYQLKGATPVYVIQEGLKSQLTDNDDVTVVFQYGDVRREMTSVDEVELIQEIVDAFPKIELIDPDRLKDIRNSLRRGQDGPWIIYFSSEESDQMKPYKVKSLLTEKEFVKNAYKNVNVGEIKCNIWPQLCLSLQIDAAPGWGALKRGGAYQRAAPGQNIASFVKTAVPALNLHTLSLSEFQRVLDGDVGTWALAVIPHKVSWDQILEPFSRASLRFVHSSSIQFGIMSCSAANDRHCRLLAENDALIVVQNGTSRRAYGGALDEAGIVGFIDLLKDGVVTEVVTDEQLYQVFDAASRSHSWLLAFLPSHCGRACSQHYYQWQLVAQKLQPLSSVRVALVDCAQASLGICANVASPSLRLYPSRSDRNYVANLQKLGTAPYIWSWALKLIDEVHPLSWHVFSRTVIAEELDPSRVKKPWLVYFHSPRCSHCYEKYADFAIAAIKLNNRLNVGRVNCLEEMGVCNHEEITHYPALKLYLGRSRERAFSRVIPVPLDNYKIIYAKVVPFLAEYPVHAAGARATSHDEL